MKAVVILFLISLAIFGFAKALDAWLDYLLEKYAEEKHFCNDCKNAYILTKKYMSLRHCTECGRVLTPFYGRERGEVPREAVFEEFESKEKSE